MQEMEIIINLVAAIVFLTLALGSAFCSYYFWLSKNGILRKLLIRKFITMAIVWLTFGVLVYFTKPDWVVVLAILVCLPYLWQKLLLIRYLIANTKNKS